MPHLSAILLLAAAVPPPAGKTVVVPPGYDRAYDDWHYAPAVRVGDLVIVSGIPAGKGETYQDKVRDMFERLRQTLKSAGAELSDVVELQTFHATARDTAGFQKEFAEFSKVHHEYFPSGYPAWTAVGATALLAPGAVVELRALAVIGAGKHITVARAPAEQKP